MSIRPPASILSQTPRTYDTNIAFDGHLSDAMTAWSRGEDVDAADVSVDARHESKGVEALGAPGGEVSIMAVQIGAEPRSATDSTSSDGSRRTPSAQAAHFHWIVADPVPIGTALFAFALAIYGVRFSDVRAATVAAGPVTVGLNYAVLIAAISESICGVLAVMKGLTYKGYILGIFGIWLWGFFFLITAGAASKTFTPDSVGWYALLLCIPAIIMAVPAIKQRNIPLSMAFIGLITLQLFLGLGYHEVYNAVSSATATHSAPKLSTAVTMLKISAWAGWVASASLFWLFARDVYEETGVLPRHESLA
jgi:GPR1/FUN34/yaaH family